MEVALSPIEEFPWLKADIGIVKGKNIAQNNVSFR